MTGCAVLRVYSNFNPGLTETARILLRANFDPKFEIPVDCFLFEYELWLRFRQCICYFKRNTAFVMQNFRILGASEVMEEMKFY